MCQVQSLGVGIKNKKQQLDYERKSIIILFKVYLQVPGPSPHTYVAEGKS